MKRAFLGVIAVIFSVIFPVALRAADNIHGLYYKTFGNASNQALLFVHGGPGDDSSLFEVTDAWILAAKGYFVVVYDERGQGRSTFASGMTAYNYNTYADDIMAMISQLKLKDPVLLAHSHGGSIAAHFDEKYPGVAKMIILLDAPTNLWALFADMEANCAQLYQQAHDPNGPQHFAEHIQTITKDERALPGQNLEELNRAVEDVFGLAMSCGHPLGLYVAQDADPSAKLLYPAWQAFWNANVLPSLKAAPWDMDPVKGFLENDNYIKVDFSGWVTKNQQRYFGIYGDEDGLFSSQSLEAIKKLLGNKPNSFQLIHGASHNVFVDQQEAFNKALLRILQ